MTKRKARETVRRARETVITTTVKGDISGMFAAGQDIEQKQQIQNGPVTDPKVMLEDWTAQLTALKQALADANLPDKTKNVADARLDDLEEQVKSGKPKQDILDQVGNWFAGHIPELLTAITSLLTHPAVTKMIENGAKTLLI